MKTDWLHAYILVIGGVSGLWFLVMALSKEHKEATKWHRKQTETFRRHADQSHELLRQMKKSNRLLRELIAELRTARQAPDPPPPELSN
jgi:hypothetical protein